METPVSTILDHKGRQVTTISPARSLAEAAALMTTDGIGSLVVSTDGRGIEGVLSERDIVRRLAVDGPGALDHRVGGVMSTPVTTCTPSTTVGELMAVMTERRIRHVPVVVDGALAGIVSIGDVVKERIAALEITSEQLQAYVSGSY